MRVVCFLLFLGIFGSSLLALAQQSPTLSDAELEAYQDEYWDRTQDLDWFAVRNEDVWMALGRDTRVPTRLEMREWLEEYAKGSPRISEEVHGVLLKDQPRVLVELFKALTTDRNPETQRSFSTPIPCGRFYCALDSVLGREIAIPLAYMLARHGYNGSHWVGYGTVGSVYSTPYKIEELEDVLIALNDLPDHWKEYSNGHPLVRFPRGKTLARYLFRGVYADSEISLFSAWEENTSEGRHETIFHEVSHLVSDQMGDEESDEMLCCGEAWLATSGGWEARHVPIKLPSGIAVKRSRQAPLNLRSMVSKYAFQNSREDFAEAAVTYRYRPDFLKQKSPEKYEFMRKNVFGGIEYLPFKVFLDALWRYRELTARDRYMMDLDQDGDVDIEDAEAYIQTEELREPPEDYDRDTAPELIRESDRRYATPRDQLTSLVTEALDYRSHSLAVLDYLDPLERRRRFRYYLQLVEILRDTALGASRAGVIDQETAETFLSHVQSLRSFVSEEDLEVMKQPYPDFRASVLADPDWDF